MTPLSPVWFYHLSTLISGTVLAALTMLASFTGYSIANGNMSYWGISVILGLVKPIDSLYIGILGGYV